VREPVHDSGSVSPSPNVALQPTCGARLRRGAELRRRRMRLNFGVRRRGARAGAEASAPLPCPRAETSFYCGFSASPSAEHIAIIAAPFCAMRITRPGMTFYCAASADMLAPHPAVRRRYSLGLSRTRPPSPRSTNVLYAAESLKLRGAEEADELLSPELPPLWAPAKTADHLLRCGGFRSNAAGALRRSRQAAEPTTVPPQHPTGPEPEVQHRTRTPGGERRRPTHASARKPLSARHFA
jgi:hypothetical protein